MIYEKPPGLGGSWIATDSVLNSTGLYTTPKEDAVTSALRLLVQVVSCPSITITVQDTSGDFCAALATLRLEGYAMTLKHSSELQNTCVSLQRMTSSEG